MGNVFANDIFTVGLHYLQYYGYLFSFTHHLDIGYYKPATVTGGVFQDLNSNGVRGTAVDPGLGVRSFLDGNGNKYPDSSEPSLQAPLSGLVQYSDVSPQPAPYRFLPYGSGMRWQTTMSSTFTIVSGQPAPSLQIGLYRPGSISGLIWNDVNANGIWEDDETRLPAEALFNVRLYINGTPGWVQTVQTSDYYVFDVAPGSYIIEIELATTFNSYQVLSSPNQGGAMRLTAIFRR